MPEAQIRLEQVKDANSTNLLVILSNVIANTANAYAEANTANATANLAFPIAGGTITGNLTILKNAYIEGDLIVTGNLVIGANLSVGGIMNVSTIVGLTGINPS